MKIGNSKVNYYLTQMYNFIGSKFNFEGHPF